MSQESEVRSSRQEARTSFQFAVVIDLPSLLTLLVGQPDIQGDKTG